MNKGIVLDIKKRSIVVLTPDGEFINCKKKLNAYVIGQEIVFHEQEKRQVSFSVPSILKPASLIFTCFLCVFLFLFNQPEEKALAYVSIDINPSIEASVTKNLRVTELRACNEDGKRILKELKRWKNEPLQDVVRAIVKQSKEDGYLTSDKQVMLTSVAKEKSLEPQLEKTIQELKGEYDAKHVTVIYQESTMQMRENAQKAGVSTGTYLKQENEKKSSVSPAPPQVQEEQRPEVDSQPDSSPHSDSQSNSSSSVQHERTEQKEEKDQQQRQQQQQPAHVPPPSQERNNGHREENNDKEQKKEYQEQKKEEQGQKKEQKKAYHEQQKEQKEYEKEQKEQQKEHKHEEKEKGKHN